MNLPFDPLREAIRSQLNRAVSTRRARGASLEELGLEFGLTTEALGLIARSNDKVPEMCVPTARRRGRSNSRLPGR